MSIAQTPNMGTYLLQFWFIVNSYTRSSKVTRKGNVRYRYSFGSIRTTVTTEHDMNLLLQFLDNHRCEKSKNDNQDDRR